MLDVFLLLSGLLSGIYVFRDVLRDTLKFIKNRFSRSASNNDTPPEFDPDPDDPDPSPKTNKEKVIWSKPEIFNSKFTIYVTRRDDSSTRDELMLSSGQTIYESLKELEREVILNVGGTGTRLEPVGLAGDPDLITIADYWPDEPLIDLPLRKKHAHPSDAVPATRTFGDEMMWRFENLLSATFEHVIVHEPALPPLVDLIAECPQAFDGSARAMAFATGDAPFALARVQGLAALFDEDDVLGKAELSHASAIDRPYLTSDKARRIGQKPSDQFADLMWGAGATDWMDAADLGAKLDRVGQAGDEVFVEFGVDPAWRNRIAPNTIGAMINGNGTGQRMKPALGRAVSGMPWVGTKPLDRADIDDSAILFNQMGHGAPHQQEGRSQV